MNVTQPASSVEIPDVTHDESFATTRTTCCSASLAPLPLDEEHAPNTITTAADTAVPVDTIDVFMNPSLTA